MTQHTLRAGDLELVVDAQRGGSIMAFRQGRFDLMRPWDGASDDPRSYASGCRRSSPRCCTTGRNPRPATPPTRCS